MKRFPTLAESARRVGKRAWFSVLAAGQGKHRGFSFLSEFHFVSGQSKAQVKLS